MVTQGSYIHTNMETQCAYAPTRNRKTLYEYKHFACNEIILGNLRLIQLMNTKIQTNAITQGDHRDVNRSLTNAKVI